MTGVAEARASIMERLCTSMVEAEVKTWVFARNWGIFSWGSLPLKVMFLRSSFLVSFLSLFWYLGRRGSPRSRSW